MMTMEKDYRIDPFSKIDILTTIINSENLPVNLECVEWTNPNKDTTWIMLTAVSSGSAVGFLDLRYYPLGELKFAKLEAPLRTVAFNIGAPHQQIRAESVSGNDGFFVLPENRGQGLGSEMLRRALDILKLKGADELIVILPKKNSLGLYTRLGGVQYHGEMSNIHFKIK